MNCLIDDNDISRMPCDDRLGMARGGSRTVPKATSQGNKWYAWGERLGRERVESMFTVVVLCILHKIPG